MANVLDSPMFVLDTIRRHLKMPCKITQSDLDRPSKVFLINFFAAFTAYVNDVINEFAIDDETECNIMEKFDSNQPEIFKITKATQLILNSLEVKYFSVSDVVLPSKQVQTTFKVCCLYIHVVTNEKKVALEIFQNVLEEMESFNKLQDKHKELLATKDSKIKCKGQLLINLQKWNEAIVKETERYEKMKGKEADDIAEVKLQKSKIKTAKQDNEIKNDILALLLKEEEELQQQPVTENEITSLLQIKEQLTSRKETLIRSINDLESSEAMIVEMDDHLKTSTNEISAWPPNNLETFSELHNIKTELLQTSNEIKKRVVYEKQINALKEAEKDFAKQEAMLMAERAEKRAMHEENIRKLKEKNESCQLLRNKADKKYLEIAKLIEEQETEIKDLIDSTNTVKEHHRDCYKEILEAEQKLVGLYHCEE